MEDVKITNALGIVTGLLLYVVFVLGYIHVVTNIEDPNALAHVGILMVVLGPGIISVWVSSMALKALRKEQDVIGDRRERNGMVRGYDIAMDGVRMIAHTKIAQDEQIDIYLENGDKSKITMREFTLRHLQKIKENIH